MTNISDNTKALEDSRSEAELALWRACAEGDESARDELILAYRPMVYWFAKKLKVPYSTYPDLIQEGMVALINAVDVFDVKRNNRFSTYAYYKIRGRMINFLQRVEAKAPIPVDDDVFDDDNRTAISWSDTSSSEWTIDLQQAMEKLTDREANIINALIVEGKPAKDVASEISLDVSHVYRIRRKALSKLKKWLGSGDQEATSLS